MKTYLLLSLFTFGAFAATATAQIVGTPFAVGDESGTDEKTAVAYEPFSQRYLVVWTVPTTGSMADMYGQLLEADGDKIGSAFVIDTAVDRDVRPSVANVGPAFVFLVGYHRNLTGPFPTVADQRWLIRTVDAAGTVSSRVTVPHDTITGAPTEIVVGGTSGSFPIPGSPKPGLVVVRRGTASSNNIAFAIVDCSSSVPSLGLFTALVLQPDRVGDLAIAAYGANGWLVAWAESDDTTALYEKIRCTIVAATGSFCPTSHILWSGSGVVRTPAIATEDFTRSAVLWQAGGDIVGRSFEWDGGCAVGSFDNGPLVTVATGDCARPTLTFAQSKYLAAWRRSGAGGPSTVAAKRLDPVTCAACSQEWPIEPSANAQSWVAVAAPWNGGLPSDEAMLVWSDGTIRGSRCTMSGTDVVVSLGGGCASPGNLAAHQGECVIGNANFELRVTAPTAPVLALIVGFAPVAAPCGGCTIVPQPDILFPGINPTTLAIPCDPLLVGANLWTQWLLLKPSSCPILPDFSFTNALRFTIGE